MRKTPLLALFVALTVGVGPRAAASEPPSDGLDWAMLLDPAGSVPPPAGDERHQAEYSPAVRGRAVRRGVMLPQRDLTRQDIETLAGWNVNLVRFQFCRNWGRRGTDRDLADYDRWFDGRLANLDFLLAEAPKYGIQVVIDLHSPPGGRKDPHNIMALFDEPEYARHFLDLWRRLATRYRGHPAVWAFDLLNEPAALDHTGGAWTLQAIAARLVRAIDPETPILVTTNWGGGTWGWDTMRPLALKNILYQFHFYNPLEYTHQFVHQPRGPDENLRAYPGPIADREGRTEDWNKERLRRELAGVLAFRKKHGALFYVGEFSAVGWAPGAERYLRDGIELFEEYGWSWSYHSFRESPFWDVEREYAGERNFVPAPAPTARQKVLLDYFARNLKE